MTADDPEQATAVAAMHTLDAENAQHDRTSRARFGVELTRAKLSLRLLLVCAVAVPLLALCTWVGVGALVVNVPAGHSARWASALTLGITLQVLVLAVLMRQMRRWWRDLGMPQSQAALGRGQQRMDVDQARKHAEDAGAVA